MSKKKRAVILTVSIGLVLAIMLFVFLTQLEKEILSDYETMQVVRSVREIPAGTLIVESNVNHYFSVEDINAKIVTPETVCTLSALYGAYVTRDISAGEVIYSKVLCAEDMQTEGYKQPVEISLRIEDVANGVAGTIRKGDFINIYVNGADTFDKDVEFKEVLNGVKVNEVYDSAGTLIGMSDSVEKAGILTFYVEEDKVAELQTQFASGTIIISKKVEK